MADALSKGSATRHLDMKPNMGELDENSRFTVEIYKVSKYSIKQVLKVLSHFKQYLKVLYVYKIYISEYINYRTL